MSAAPGRPQTSSHRGAQHGGIQVSAVMQDARLKKFAKRKRVNQIALVLSLAAMCFGLFWLFWILLETVRLGIGGISLATFTEMTPSPQAEDNPKRLYSLV